jgi:hypothetical protein
MRALQVEVIPVNARVRFETCNTTTDRAFGASVPAMCSHVLVAIARGGGSPGIPPSDS